MLAIALSAFLLWPLVPSGSELRPEPAVRALLVDTSASTVRRRPDWVAWVRRTLAREVAEARLAGEEVALVTFARDTERLFGPGPPDELADWIEGRGRDPLNPRPAASTAGADAHSHLARALLLAEAWVRSAEREPGQIAVLGDREFSGADPDGMLRALVASGRGLRWIEPAASELPDAELVGLTLPAELPEGAPLGVRVQVRLDPGVPRQRSRVSADSMLSVALEVELREGAAAPRLLSFPSVLSVRSGAAARTEWVDLNLGRTVPGLVSLRVRALVPHDPLPENNERMGSLRVGGQRVVAVLASSEARGDGLPWRSQVSEPPLAGIQFVSLAPNEFAAQAQRFDALVTVDLPMRALPARAVARFVEGGGGWLRAEGWSFLQFGSSELDGLAPLEPRPSEEEERDVLVFVDGSGSMAGEPFEAVRGAALELVHAAATGGEVALRFFTSGLHPGRLLRARGTADDPGAAVQELLSLRVPRGSTRILFSLEQLLAERAGAERELLVLLLTDGREEIGALRGAARFEALRAELARTRTQLAVVAVGEQADLDFLGQLLVPGQVLRRAEQLEDLEELFQAEVHGERAHSGQELAAFWASQSRFAPASSGSSTGATATNLPPLQRYLRAALRPGAEAVIVDTDGEPILAFARAGLGRVAVWVSTPRIGWAPGWRGPRAAVALGPLIRELARRPRERPRAAHCEGQWLTVEGLGEGTEAQAPSHSASILAAYPRGGDLDATALEQELLRVELRPVTSPGGMGLAGAFGVRLGTEELRLLRERGASAGAELVLLLDDSADAGVGPIALELLAPSEFRTGARDRSRVAAAAPDPFRAPAERRSTPHPLGPWVLGAGLLLVAFAALARPAG